MCSGSGTTRTVVLRWLVVTLAAVHFGVAIDASRSRIRNRLNIGSLLDECVDDFSCSLLLRNVRSYCKESKECIVGRVQGDEECAEIITEMKNTKLSNKNYCYEKHLAEFSLQARIGRIKLKMCNKVMKFITKDLCSASADEDGFSVTSNHLNARRSRSRGNPMDANRRRSDQHRNRYPPRRGDNNYAGGQPGYGADGKAPHSRRSNATSSGDGDLVRMHARMMFGEAEPKGTSTPQPTLTRSPRIVKSITSATPTLPQELFFVAGVLCAMALMVCIFSLLICRSKSADSLVTELYTKDVQSVAAAATRHDQANSSNNNSDELIQSMLRSDKEGEKSRQLE